MSGRRYDSRVIIWAAENNGKSFAPGPMPRIVDIVAFVEISKSAHLSLAICLLFRYCVFAKNETEETTMMNQLPVTRCQHCTSEDIRVGWQSDALVTFTRNGLLGNRLKFLICGNCGAVLYQCVAEPHRFPQAK